MSPADMNAFIDALRNMLCEFEPVSVDGYAEITVPACTHPEESTEYATYPPGTWEDVGPWKPYAAAMMDVDHDRNGRFRTVPARCWRRALRRVAS